MGIQKEILENVFENLREAHSQTWAISILTSKPMWVALYFTLARVTTKFSLFAHGTSLVNKLTADTMHQEMFQSQTWRRISCIAVD